MHTTTESAWAPGPLHPLLAKGAVHVWRADLTAVSGDAGELLSSNERARAERFVSAHDGERWRRARGLLRALLGRYLQREPGSLRFVVGEHGKPALADDDGSPLASAHQEPAQRQRERAQTGRTSGLSFNMSHSGSLALYAFSDAGAVGVDVEIARRPIDELAIATRTFGKITAERLRALDPAARQREFLRAWARHEAGLKCLGTGLGGAAASAELRALRVIELDVGEDVAAAVACELAPSELCRWLWPSV